MSDMEDDFMCDDEEDYDLVFTVGIGFFALEFQPFVHRSAQSEVQS